MGKVVRRVERAFFPDFHQITNIPQGEEKTKRYERKGGERNSRFYRKVRATRVFKVNPKGT